eukprot:TRINITY_DN1477_c0_g2_i3.p1 TRINITY_DN1477_c0_g2~~TRINITY_DN1477_c0_g2_i3.p1  ORF type:complete len:351 (+),score=67.89 TRINITY_DN1477_c0_g2_i3:67-1119(+)
MCIRDRYQRRVHGDIQNIGMNKQDQSNFPYPLPFTATMKSSISCPDLFGMRPFAFAFEHAGFNYNPDPQLQNTNFFPLCQQQFPFVRQPFTNCMVPPPFHYMPLLHPPTFNLIYNAENTRQNTDRDDFKKESQILQNISHPNAPAPQVKYSQENKEMQSGNIEAENKKQEEEKSNTFNRNKNIYSKVKLKPNEDSEENGDNDSIIKRLLSGEAYKSRNVYKTIIRHMHAYTRKNRNEFIKIVTSSGFTQQDIEHAFFKIDYWCNLERENGNRNYAQGIVKKILAEKTIYTIILRETLNALLHSWQLGRFGKIIKKNRDVYIRACQKFYDETVSILEQPAQGTSFDFQQPN